MASWKGTLVLDEQATLEEYIQELDKKRCLLFDFEGLSPQKHRSIQNAFSLVYHSEPISHNSYKKRARDFLCEVFKHNKKLFMLCGISTSQTTQGSIRTRDFSILWEWWLRVEHPPALEQLVRFFAEHFEKKPRIEPARQARKRQRAESEDTFKSDTSTLRRTFGNNSQADEAGFGALNRRVEEYEMVLKRLYPTRDASSLLPLSRHELISLLSEDESGGIERGGYDVLTQEVGTPFSTPSLAPTVEGSEVEHLSNFINEYNGGHCPLTIRLHPHEPQLLPEIRIAFEKHTSDLDGTSRNRSPVEDPGQPDNLLLTDHSIATLADQVEQFDIAITFQRKAVQDLIGFVLEKDLGPIRFV